MQSYSKFNFRTCDWSQSNGPFHRSVSTAPVPSTILAPIFHIRSLEELFIRFTNIQGEIPAVGFANLSNLVDLDLSTNNFSGSVPPQLFHLPLLQYLYLDDNSLSGKVTEEIGNLSRLQRLSLSGNRSN